MNDHTAAVIELVAKVLELSPQQVPADASMDTLAEWDSLAQLRICMDVQERFGIVMDLDAIAEATSIPALAALVR